MTSTTTNYIPWHVDPQRVVCSMIWYQQLTMLTDLLDIIVLVIGVSNNLTKVQKWSPRAVDRNLWRHLHSNLLYHNISLCLVHQSEAVVSGTNHTDNWSRPSIIFSSADCFIYSPDGDAYDSCLSDSSMKVCDVETTHSIEEAALALHQICINDSQDAWCG